MSHFNEIANQWDIPDNVARSLVFANAIRPHVPEAANIMELGCGTGLLSYQFLDGATGILGVDTSKGMLEVFDRKGAGNPKVRSALLDLENEDLAPHAPFDLVASTMAFHHLHKPAEMVRKLKGTLSSRGVLAVIDLEAEDGTFHPDNARMGVRHFGFSPAELQAWATGAGFRAPEVSTVHVIEKNGRGYPVFLALFRP